MYKIYLAGPIAGKTYAESATWRDDFVNIARVYDFPFEGISPLRGKSELLSEGQQFDHLGIDSNPISTSKAVFARDTFDVKRCDAVLVNLQQTSLSVGTLVELGMAHAYGKPIFALKGDNSNPKVIDHIFVEQMVYSWHWHTLDAVRMMATFFNINKEVL
jgi:nucleoside 2-deoxyribosyltransferase